MQEPTPRSRAWLTRQALRTWYVGCDAARLVSGLGGVFRSSFAPRPPAAGFAALAGEAVACVGSPSRYRVRVVNPTATARTLRVVVTAWLDDASALSFELTWDVTLAPGEIAERWFETTWRRNDARFVAASGSSEPPPLIVGRPAGRWTIETHLTGTAPADEDRLRISGTFVQPHSPR